MLFFETQCIRCHNMSMKSLQWQSTPGSCDECRTAPDDCQPLDQAEGLEPLARLQAAKKLHPPSPFIITQPESWYSFYHPTEGRRHSWPRGVVIYSNGLHACKQSPIQSNNWAQCRLTTLIEANVLTTALHRHPLCCYAVKIRRSREANPDKVNSCPPYI